LEAAGKVEAKVEVEEVGGWRRFRKFRKVEVGR
jgi:hypothetical protein